MAYETVLLEKQDKIARIILNRPEKLNAINPQLRVDLEAALGELEGDRGISVVIIKGAGRAFCSGYDISQGGAVARGQAERNISTDREGLLASVQRWLRLWSLPKVTIAQVHGYCLAGGNEITGICDLMVAAEDALFGQPQGRALGIAPTLGFWPYLMGPRRTKEWLFTGDSFTGKEAAAMGLANKAVPAASLDEEVERLARRIALTPLDFLVVEKAATNRYLELMGIHAAAAAGAELDAVYHASPSFDFFSQVRERGLKAALDRRDTPFQDYRGAGQPGR